MRILFEEHQYEPYYLGDVVKDVMGADTNIEDKKLSLSYVGYFFSPAVGDCVFILPKVLLTDVKGADGKPIEVVAHVTTKDGSHVTPEDIVSPEGQEKWLSPEYRKFLYEFAVWVYRAISVYKQTTNTQAVYSKQLPEEGRGRRRHANTYLDIILSLIRFNKENQDFFMFVVKNQHSGMNKINWTKTISKSNAVLQGGVRNPSMVYFNPVNKRRMINFDEELLIIFFSILNYLGEFGFKIPINCQYELITGSRFKAMCQGRGKRRLRDIKYKYFSDKALELWDLCYAFFEATHDISINMVQKEYLLARSFEHVFEAMIDELIGTPHNAIPKGLADQDDGKRVDHMYPYQSLTSDEKNEQVYYIGDSKYYKSGHRLGKESVYKQYTYARNVIQWNIDLFMNDKQRVLSEQEREDMESDKTRFGNIRLRHDSAEGNITEGYNVIPNFFLSAFVEKDHDYDKGNNIRLHTQGKDADGNEKHSTYITRQWQNRLFDRDTLILSHYDVNFLYVLYLYARNKAAEKAVWRKRVREIFRDEIRKVLHKEFDFYAMTPHAEGVDEKYIKTHFQDVLGKIYTPYTDKSIYSLALDKKDSEGKNKELLEELKQHFFVTKPIDLGTDPTEELNEQKTQEGWMYVATKSNEASCIIVNVEGSRYIKSEELLSRDPRFGVAIQDEVGEDGKHHNVLRLDEGITRVAYIVVTNKRECEVYLVDNKPIFLPGQSVGDIFTTKKDALVYLVFNLQNITPIERTIFNNSIDMDRVRSLLGAGHEPKLVPFSIIAKN